MVRRVLVVMGTAGLLYLPGPGVTAERQSPPTTPPPATKVVPRGDVGSGDPCPAMEGHVDGRPVDHDVMMREMASGGEPTPEMRQAMQEHMSAMHAHMAENESCRQIHREMHAMHAEMQQRTVAGRADAMRADAGVRTRVDARPRSRAALDDGAAGECAAIRASAMAHMRDMDTPRPAAHKREPMHGMQEQMDGMQEQMLRAHRLMGTGAECRQMHRELHALQAAMQAEHVRMARAERMEAKGSATRADTPHDQHPRSRH